MTATSVATQAVTIVAVLRGLSETSRTIQLVCRPMSRKTAFSSRNANVRQLRRSAIRDDGVCSSGALWPSARPATTTASTPEAWISSATT